MNPRKALCLVLGLALGFVSTTIADDFHCIKKDVSLVDPHALTIDGNFGQSINGLSFQQDAVVTHEKFQYVGYYDGDRRVCIGRRELPSGSWEVVRFADYDFRSNDAHNTISIGVCPADGTIHMAFDHHGHPLHYRVSRQGAASRPKEIAWDASLFGPIADHLEEDRPIRLTYPRFLQTPDGGLQFFYRRGGSGNGDRMMVDYNPESASWSDTRQIDSGKGHYEDRYGKSGSRCSYPNGYDYGPDGKLHMTWVWRENAQGANHDLMYAYSENGGVVWKTNDGRVLPSPAAVDSPEVTVVEIDRGYGLMNTHGQTVDSKGRVHVAMWHCTDSSLQAAGSHPGETRWGPGEAHRNHHYWRDLEGGWHHTVLPGVAGTRPKIFTDENDNAYIIYTDAWKRSVFGREGTVILLAATADSRWEDWRVIHVERGPFGNEMQIDRHRWKNEGILSVLVQETPNEKHQPTALKIMDFMIERR